MRVSVVVLGDLGRSPRMLYHALALAESGADVDLIGLTGTDPVLAVLTHPRITCHRLRDSGASGARRLPRPLYLLFAFARASALAVRLAFVLLARVARPDTILVQSPPAIPTLAVASIAARARKARLVIDWHNLGYAVLAQRLGARHPVVRLAAGHERAWGRRADAHLAVSRALAARLAAWGVGEAAVLYDRAAAPFAPLSPAERDEVARTLVAQVGLPRTPRPALIVCPTSWTADEDVELLLDAAGRCDLLLRAASAAAAAQGPRLVVLITGLGPNRADFEARIAGRRMGPIALRTLWLSAADYARALAAADLGLCLHRSASSLDLPMKLADMRGAALPACALDYAPVLAERFRDGEHGVTLRDAESLARLLRDLATGSPDLANRLARIRARLIAEPDMRWSDGWALDARAAILGS